MKNEREGEKGESTGLGLGLGEETSTEPVVDSDYLIEEYLSISRDMLCSYVRNFFRANYTTFYQERRPYFKEVERFKEDRDLCRIIYCLGNPYIDVTENQEKEIHVMVNALTEKLNLYLNKGLAFSLVLTDKKDESG